MTYRPRSRHTARARHTARSRHTARPLSSSSTVPSLYSGYGYSSGLSLCLGFGRIVFIVIDADQFHIGVFV